MRRGRLAEVVIAGAPLLEDDEGVVVDASLELVVVGVFRRRWVAVPSVMTSSWCTNESAVLPQTIQFLRSIQRRTTEESTLLKAENIMGNQSSSGSSGEGGGSGWYLSPELQGK